MRESVESDFGRLRSNTTYTVVEAYNGEEVIINHPNFVVYNADYSPFGVP